MIVAKFGGTSMGTAEAMKRTAEIIRGLKGKKAVVVSATSGTTDTLIRLSELALHKKNWHKELKNLQKKHEEIVDNLQTATNLSDFWEEISRVLHGIELLEELSLTAKDKLLSYGERLSSTILADYMTKIDLKARMYDSYNFVFTDNNFGEGNINFKKTSKKIKKILSQPLEENIIPIITGFIGRSENNHYITLGRGGSDFSGAIIASALNADELQIWTDVDGIYDIDPRLEKRAKVLSTISFNEASELAYFGAKVLHPKTIKPAVEKNIPVKILNTFNPKAKGTTIVKEETLSLKSVTFKKGISIINVCSAGMLNAHGFLAKIFQVFADQKVSVDVIATSEVSVSLTVENSSYTKVEKLLAKFSTVSIEKNMAIVCLVGSSIGSDAKILSALFSAIKTHDVHMVSQGASKRNITFLVKEVEAPEVAKKIFNQFFNKI